MSRSQRLFDLLQLLRCHKYPVSGTVLAQALNISLRTLYRDIATLQSQGAEIDGEAGIGYVLKPGFELPPLMFTIEELEVLRLGAEWAARQNEGEMSDPARNAIAKIASVLPATHRLKFTEEVMRIAQQSGPEKGTADMAKIRSAIRDQRKVNIQYLDREEQASSRVIWPL